MTTTQSEIRTKVQEHYAKSAQASAGCCGGDRFYDIAVLDEMPSEIANFSMGCGDPITIAELQAGETVLDLGSGGGLDCFLAAKRVGEKGRVIGVDMTPEMLARARGTAERLGIQNVEFREGHLEDLPVDSGSVDVVISNCVINLSPDKPQVFREIARVLKPGGRVSVSDVLRTGELPEEMQNDMEAWSSCAAGALLVDEYRRGLEAAGLVDIKVTARGEEGELFEELPDSLLFSGLITGQKAA